MCKGFEEHLKASADTSAHEQSASGRSWPTGEPEGIHGPDKKRGLSPLRLALRASSASPRGRGASLEVEGSAMPEIELEWPIRDKTEPNPRSHVNPRNQFNPARTREFFLSQSPFERKIKIYINALCTLK